MIHHLSESENAASATTAVAVSSPARTASLRKLASHSQRIDRKATSSVVRDVSPNVSPSAEHKTSLMFEVR